MQVTNTYLHIGQRENTKRRSRMAGLRQTTARSLLCGRRVGYE